jgi:hypothetical protein
MLSRFQDFLSAVEATKDEENERLEKANGHKLKLHCRKNVATQLR